MTSMGCWNVLILYTSWLKLSMERMGSILIATTMNKKTFGRVYICGEVEVDLSHYCKIKEDSEIQHALKEGLKEVQRMLRGLNMAPSAIACDKTWFHQPWKEEAKDVKHWDYVPSRSHVAREDGDGEALKESLATPMEVLCTREGNAHLEDDLVFDDELDATPVMRGK